MAMRTEDRVMDLQIRLFLLRADVEMIFNININIMMLAQKRVWPISLLFDQLIK